MQPGTEELRFLLKWAFGDVEAARSKAAPFNLLKAVITRRLVVPEVYDLMDRVQELLIKSHVRIWIFCHPFAGCQHFLESLHQQVTSKHGHEVYIECRTQHINRGVGDWCCQRG